METMIINSELLKEIEQYSCDLILKESPEYLIYHTLEHTRQVVRNAELIGQKEKLNEEDMHILLASAWFHDLGYTTKYVGHEAESVAIADLFLKNKEVDKKIRGRVSEAILATTFPYEPKSKIAEVLCDADMMHLGADNYFETAEKLRQEWANLGVKRLKKLEFEEESVLLFEKHTYFTKYGRTELAANKKRNLELIEESISKRKKKKSARMRFR